MIRRTLKLRRLRRDIRGLFRLWAVMKMSARWSEKAEIFEAKHNAACREYNRTRFCFMRRPHSWASRCRRNAGRGCWK